MEHLTCQIDRASKIEMEFTQDSEKAIRALVPEERDEVTEEDLTCEICEEPNSIPRARALRGYTTCVSCASYAEKANKRTKHPRNYEYDD